MPAMTVRGSFDASVKVDSAWDMSGAIEAVCPGKLPAETDSISARQRITRKIRGIVGTAERFLNLAIGFALGRLASIRIQVQVVNRQFALLYLNVGGLSTQEGMATNWPAR